MQWLTGVVGLLAILYLIPAHAQQGCVLDLVFVVDSSGSIRDNNVGQVDNFKVMLDFINELLRNLNVSPSGTRVGVVNFSDKGKNTFFMNDQSSFSAIGNKISALQYFGSNTNTAAGIRVMSEEQFVPHRGDRSNVPNVAIVLTDGQSTTDNHSTIPEAVKARNKGIEIIVIGVTSRTKESELRDISSSPHLINENYFLAPSFSTLRLIEDAIARQACLKAAVTPAPTPATVIPLPECRTAFLDLVFIVDSSDSIKARNVPGGADNFELMKGFINNIVDSLPISPFQVQVGLVDYASLASSVFYLNSFNNVQDIKNAINTMPYFGTRTNTSGAIRLMMNDQFRNFRGDRSNAQNYAIILTDGLSDIDRHRTIQDAEVARARGIEIFAIGITEAADDNELKFMSSAPQRSLDILEGKHIYGTK